MLAFLFDRYQYLLMLIHEISNKTIFHDDLAVAFPIVFKNNLDLWEEFKSFLPVTCSHFAASDPSEASGLRSTVKHQLTTKASIASRISKRGTKLRNPGKNMLYFLRSIACGPC